MSQLSSHPKKRARQERAMQRFAEREAEAREHPHVAPPPSRPREMWLPRMAFEDSAPEWSCARKKGYPTEKIAHQVASRINEEQGVNLVTYGCPHCGRYHIGRANGLGVVTGAE